MADLIGFALQHDLTDVEDDDAVADAADERQVVLDDQDRFSVLFECADQVGDLSGHLRRHSRRRLIEEEELFAARECSRDFEEAHLPAGEAACFLVRMVTEVDHFQCFMYAFSQVAKSKTLLAPKRLEGDEDILLERHITEDAEILEHTPDADTRAFARREIGDVNTSKRNMAVRGPEEPREHVEERRLPRAVRADETDDLTLFDFERNIVEDALPGNRQSDIANGEDGRHAQNDTRNPARAILHSMETQSIDWRCPIGTLRITADGSTITGIEILRRSARPSRTTRGHSRLIAQCTRELAEYFAGKRQAFDVPIHAAPGSDFDQRVWTALRRIPRGKTVSYGQLARAIGKPGAARAVGTACGRNPLLIVVPCHRVIASSGSLGGFSAGLSRKRRLLALER